MKTYRVEVKKLYKSIARRKAWKKFGAAERDPPGPNPSNTIISEDVYMQFVHTKETVRELEDTLVSFCYIHILYGFKLKSLSLLIYV